MAERPTKRLRSLSTEYDDGERNDDWIPQNQESKIPTVLSQLDPTTTAMSRPRRTPSGASAPSVTVARVPSQSPEGTKKSIHLTVKMPSNKLREATSGLRKSVSVNARDKFEPGEILSGPRGSRAKRNIVVESASEDEEEEEEEDDQEEAVLSLSEGMRDVDEEDEDEDAENEDEDAEGESDDRDLSADADADADGDVEMEDIAPPSAPIIKMTGPASKPSLIVTPAHDGKVKSVEAKEMQLEDDDDEELSDLDSDAEAEDVDAEGEEIGEDDQELGDEGEEEEEEEEEEIDSDGGTPADGSRASTPDISKMTKRQRSRLDQVMGSDFLQLPMEPQIKKHLTAEEHAMRRAEMARRRKNLSEKRNEEEKMDTINRLLKKQTPKRRGKISANETAATAAGAAVSTATDEVSLQSVEYEKPNPVFIRWISSREGSRVGVPEEWLGSPLGRVFEGGELGRSERGGIKGGRMVEEVES